MNGEIKNKLKKKFYDRLIRGYDMEIIDDYIFIYEEVYEHLLEDTIRTYINNKNYRNNNVKFKYYALDSDESYIDTIFFRHMYSHNTLIDNLKSGSPEFKKRVRKLKIEKLNNNE